MQELIVQELIGSMITKVSKVFCHEFPTKLDNVGIVQKLPSKESYYSTELLSLLSEEYCTRGAPFFKYYLRH